MTVVDALPAAPYGQRHLPGALNLVAEDPDERVRAVLPDPSAAVVTYSTDADCTRGPELAERLRGLGYTDVREYRDGIEDWVAAGLPLARPEAITLRLEDLMLSPTAALFQGEKDGGGVDCSIFVTRTPPGRFVELHTHPYAETFVLLAGHGRWTIGDTVVELEPDGIAIAPPMHAARVPQHRRRAAARRLRARARDAQPGVHGRPARLSGGPGRPPRAGAPPRLGLDERLEAAVAHLRHVRDRSARRPSRRPAGRRGPAPSRRRGARATRTRRRPRSAAAPVRRSRRSRRRGRRRGTRGRTARPSPSATAPNADACSRYSSMRSSRTGRRYRSM